MAPTSLKLQQDDKALKAAFLSLKTPGDLAQLLEVELKTLSYYIYKKSNYCEFAIPKRDGSSRIVCTPESPLKILQRKLAQVLQAVYGTRSPVHGFCKGRSVRSNAKRHVGSEWILTFDVQNFFPSIHYGRVAGLFAKSPYSLPKDVAATVARLTCYKGLLPTGAPTSPIISNMICAKLDAQLKDLALSHKCGYTRYADDLTISTKLSSLPSLICSKEVNSGRWMLSPEILNIVKENGFEVQDKKTTVRRRTNAQIVTGLRVNSKLNVRKDLIREVRAMVHALEVYGQEEAQNQFWSNYSNSHSLNACPPFLSVLRGKIEFIGFVKGKDDRVYVRYLQALQKASGMNAKPIIVGRDTHETLIRQCIWLLYNAGEDKQGTAFALEGGRLFTAAHNLSEPMFASRPDFSDEKYYVSVKTIFPDLDIAEISIQTFLPVQLPVYKGEQLDLLTSICVIGFPNHHLGDSVAFRFGKIVQRREYPGSKLNSPKVPHFIVDADIVKGNSGGPVVDSANRVVGVAVKGLDAPGSFGQDDQLSSFVPVSLLP